MVEVAVGEKGRRPAVARGSLDGRERIYVGLEIVKEGRGGGVTCAARRWRHISS